MSSLLYTHSIGGNGVGQGLPLRRASHLYDVEPARRYPLVLSTGTDSDLHTYDRGIYRRTPHLPITFIIEPYIANHRAGGGNFTRRQYFVIKRGQALMAATKRQAAIGMFSNAGAISTQTFVDPAKLATEGTLVGYTNGTVVIYASDDDTIRVTPAVFAALPLISVADDTALGAIALADLTAADEAVTTDELADGFTIFNDNDGKVYTYDQDAVAGDVEAGVGLDGFWIADADVADVAAAQDDLSASEVYTIAEFDALEDKNGFRGVYTGLVDTNSVIATGGVNRYAEFDEAIFGSTSLVKYVEIDADAYYFGGATRSDGFIFPSSGGAPRTLFFMELDQEAGVTLPTDGTGAAPKVVTPIGNVTDVATTNAANWYQSAVSVIALPTIGIAHTDLEQTLSHKWHMFSTGTEPHSPVRKGRLMLPFVDIVKFASVMAAAVPGTTFAVTDETGARSGLKVGVFSPATVTTNIQNKYSLLTSADSGYANLLYNFGAPFLMTRAFPTLGMKLVPDLFGNYVPYGSGALGSTATDNAGNAFGLASTARTSNMDGAVTANSDHIVGRVTGIMDIPTNSLLNLAVNPVFQSRIVDSAERNALNEGYRRVRGADTAGVQPLLADFIFLLLGGANYTWASALLPTFNGLGQDLAKVVEELVIQGACGLVEVAVNLVD